MFNSRRWPKSLRAWILVAGIVVINYGILWLLDVLPLVSFLRIQDHLLTGQVSLGERVLSCLTLLAGCYLVFLATRDLWK